MWKYFAATVLFLIGVLEIVLALNGRLREEIMKNSPIRSTRATPVLFFLAGLSAFAMALGILFYNRWF